MYTSVCVCVMNILSIMHVIYIIHSMNITYMIFTIDIDMIYMNVITCYNTYNTHPASWYIMYS